MLRFDRFDFGHLGPFALFQVEAFMNRSLKASSAALADKALPETCAIIRSLSTQLVDG